MGNRFGAIGHPGDLGEADRVPSDNAHHEVPDIIGGLEAAGETDTKGGIVSVEASESQAHVGSCQGPRHVQWGAVEGLHGRRIKPNADHPVSTPDGIDRTGSRNPLQPADDPGGNPGEIEVRQGPGRKRHRHDRDIVDILGTNENRAGTPGKIGPGLHHFAVDLDQARPHRLPDPEPDRHQRSPSHRLGVDRLDALHPVKMTFERLGDALLHLPGRGPRIGDKEIHHGDPDLRVLLPGSPKDRQPSHKEGNDDKDRGQTAVDEEASNGASDPDLRGFLADALLMFFLRGGIPAHWATSLTLAPSTKVAGGERTTFSWGESPERISTIPPTERPTLT